MAKITCPECGNVMRPAKPLKAGKRVKCSECGADFLVEDEVEEARPAKTAKATAKAAAKADPAPPKKKKKAEKKDDKPAKPADGKPSFDDDEDDGPATYGYIDDHSKHDEPDI